MRDSTRTRPPRLQDGTSDDDAVNEAVKRWRAASSAHKACYDPTDEAKSALLFEMYIKALRQLTKLRPATTSGLLMLASAVSDEIVSSGTADDPDVDWQLMCAVVRGVIDVLGGNRNHREQ